MVGVVGVRQMLIQLVLPPNVTGYIFLVFGINSVHFSISRTFSKQRGDEKLRKSIQSIIQFIRYYVKIVYCVIRVSGGVAAAPVLTQKLAVVVLVWVLLGTQKKHVFAKMRQP